MGSRDVTELSVQLESTNVDQRIEAAEQLSYLADGAQPAAVPLVRAIGDESEEVREWINSALEELGPPEAADAEALSNLLDDKNADVGYWAATLLGRLGSDASQAVPQLANVLGSQAALQVRERAAWALGKIGPPAVSAVDTLRPAAASDEARLSRLANDALEQIGAGQ
jgi:HEAT repeat protein